MDKLPNELLEHVFSFLGPADVLKLRSVCKLFKSCAYKHHNYLQRKQFNYLIRVPTATRVNRTVGIFFGPTISVKITDQRHYRSQASCKWLAREIPYDQFAAVARHVSFKNANIVKVECYILDQRTVEILCLFEYRICVSVSINTDEIQVDRHLFRHLVIRLNTAKLTLTGNFDRNFVSDSLLVATGVSIFLLDAKETDPSSIGIDFLVPFFKEIHLKHELMRYMRRTDHFMGNVSSLILPNLNIADYEGAKLENLILKFLGAEPVWQTRGVHIFIEAYSVPKPAIAAVNERFKDLENRGLFSVKGRKNADDILNLTIMGSHPSAGRIVHFILYFKKQEKGDFQNFYNKYVARSASGSSSTTDPLGPLQSRHMEVPRPSHRTVYSNEVPDSALSVNFVPWILPEINDSVSWYVQKNRYSMTRVVRAFLLRRIAELSQEKHTFLSEYWKRKEEEFHAEKISCA